MLLFFEWTVFDGLHGSIIESMKALNIFEWSCTFVRTFQFPLHIGDIEPYGDGVRSLSQCYDKSITDRNRKESAKEMHDAVKSGNEMLSLECAWRYLYEKDYDGGQKQQCKALLKRCSRFTKLVANSVVKKSEDISLL